MWRAAERIDMMGARDNADESSVSSKTMSFKQKNEGGNSFVSCDTKDPDVSMS